MTWRSVHRVTVIVLGDEINDPSSNPGCGSFRFTSRYYPGERELICFPISNHKIGQTGFFSIGEGKR